MKIYKYTDREGADYFLKGSFKLAAIGEYRNLEAGPDLMLNSQDAVADALEATEDLVIDHANTDDPSKKAALDRMGEFNGNGTVSNCRVVTRLEGFWLACFSESYSLEDLKTWNEKTGKSRSIKQAYTCCIEIDDYDAYFQALRTPFYIALESAFSGKTAEFGTEFNKVVYDWRSKGAESYEFALNPFSKRPSFAWQKELRFILAYRGLERIINPSSLIFASSEASNHCKIIAEL